MKNPSPSNIALLSFLVALLSAAWPGGAALAGEAGSPPRSSRPPNIVFFLADDLGWRDAGCYGSTFYETPNIDRLAKEGMRFTSAYAACPVCSPTRASIMTGRYPARLGITDYIGGPQPGAVSRHWTRNKPLLPASYLERLPKEEMTIAKALKQSGYATFFTGKWHLGGKGYWPEDHGFDINLGGCGAGSPASYFSPYKNPKLPDGPKGEHLDDRMAAESVKFLEGVGGKPFLLYHAFYSVHIPLQAKKDLVAKYEAKRKNVKYEGPMFRPEGDRKARQVQEHAVYAAMIETMDRGVGRVLDALDRLGLAGNAIVFFMSDNGGLSTAEGAPTSNLPLRAGKGWLYEGGIREPMIVRWPGATRPGSTCDTPVISTDFYPTILEMAGLPARPEQHVDGVSMVPLLKQTAMPTQQAVYWGTRRRHARWPWRWQIAADHAYMVPVERALYWHYPHYGNQGGSPGGAVRLGDWKLIEFFEDQRLELYNLRTDLGESHNLAAEQPQRAADLHQRLKTWRSAVGARMPMPNPNRKVEVQGRYTELDFVADD